MTPLRRTLGAVALAATAALLAACGSTVQVQGSVTRDGTLGTTGADLGLGQTTGAAQPVGPGGSPGVVGPSSGPAAGTTGAAAPGTTGNRPGPSGPATSRFPLTGRGFTKDVVYLGWGYIADDAAAAFSAFGLAGIGDPGDVEAQMKAVVDDVNARGGIAGRKVVLVPHGYSTTDIINNPDGAAQEACSDMTEDHKVFVMMLPQVTNQIAKDCFHKAGVPMLLGGGPENPLMFKDDYRKYPLYINIGGMLSDRFFYTAVERLVARSFFQKWDTARGAAGGTAPVKVGALIQEVGGDETLATYNRALAKAGLKVSEVQRLPANVGRAIALGQSAVLRFRSAGVTHVLGTTLPFINTAEQQGYRPRYFVNIAANIVAASVSPRQLNGAMTVSFAPAFDSAEGHDPGPPTAATRRCYALMRAIGQQPTNQTMKYNQVSFCDVVSFTKAAVDATGGDLSTAGLVRGIESLGSKVESATTWTTFFGPGEHASARAVRDMGYSAGCSCFLFVDKVNRRATY